MSKKIKSASNNSVSLNISFLLCDLYLYNRKDYWGNSWINFSEKTFKLVKNTFIYIFTGFT